MRGSPASGLVVYGALAEAVRRESNQAVAHWFGVTPGKVSAWRRALGVGPTTAGTSDLGWGYGAGDWFAAARAKGATTPWTAKRRASMFERFKGRSLAPPVVAAIRKAQRTRRGTKHAPEARAKMRAAAARLARGWCRTGGPGRGPRTTWCSPGRRPRRPGGPGAP